MHSRNVVEEIVAKAAELPPELQQQVLDFIEFVIQRAEKTDEPSKEVTP